MKDAHETMMKRIDRMMEIEIEISMLRADLIRYPKHPHRRNNQIKILQALLNDLTC